LPHWEQFIPLSVLRLSRTPPPRRHRNITPGERRRPGILSGPFFIGRFFQALFHLGHRLFGTFSKRRLITGSFRLLKPSPMGTHLTSVPVAGMSIDVRVTFHCPLPSGPALWARAPRGAPHPKKRSEGDLMKEASMSALSGVPRPRRLLTIAYSGRSERG